MIKQKKFKSAVICFLCSTSFHRKRFGRHVGNRKRLAHQLSVDKLTTLLRVDKTLQQPNVSWPNVSWPNVIWPNVIWPNVCWPNVCCTNVCQPNVCWPKVCWPNVFLINVCLSTKCLFDKCLSVNQMSVDQMSVEQTPYSQNTSNRFIQVFEQIKDWKDILEMIYNAEMTKCQNAHSKEFKYLEAALFYCQTPKSWNTKCLNSKVLQS